MIYNGYVSHIESDCSTIIFSREGCLKIIADIYHECSELGSKQKEWIKILGRLVKSDITKNEDGSLKINDIVFPQGRKLNEDDYQKIKARADEWCKDIKWE